jgi:hypothetical protein
MKVAVTQVPPSRMDAQARSRYERRVRELAAFGHRGSATDQERQAAAYLAGELRGMGLEPKQEPFAASGSLGARLLLHVSIAAVGAALLWSAPLATLLLGAVALLSLLAEQSSRGLFLSRGLMRSRSYNVLARIPSGRDEPKRRIILCGHYDTQRTGLLWSNRLTHCFTPLLTRLPIGTQSPFFPVTVAMALQPLIALLTVRNGHSSLVAVAGGAMLLVYGVAGFLLADWSRGAWVPGASDNASGTAAVLALAEAWQEDPVEGVELIVLLTGCEESGLLGAAAWAAVDRAAVSALPTHFLNLDGLGFGPPRFLGREVPVAGPSLSYPATLLALCAQLAREEGLREAGPQTMSGPTDGLALLAHGLAGVTVIGCEKGGRLPHYHQLTDTPDRMNFEAAWHGVEFVWQILRCLARAEHTLETRPGSSH